MRNLTDSQKWALVAFAVAASTAAITFFLQAEVRTFAYMLVGLGVAAFAVLQGGREDDEKRKGREE
jgi:hypothetical protein